MPKYLSKLPSLVGGGAHVPKTYTADELNPLLDEGVPLLPHGRFQFIRYIKNEDVFAFQQDAPGVVPIRIPLPLLIPRLNLPELTALGRIHGIKRPRGALRHNVLASFEGHACLACEDHVSLVLPCAGNVLRNADVERNVVNQDVIQRLARSVKTLTLGEINTVAAIPPDLLSDYETGAQFVTLTLFAGVDLLPQFPDDHILTDPVPWLRLATKGTKPVAQYLAGLHGIDVWKRSKPELIQDLSTHVCVDCPDYRAIFKPAQLPSRPKKRRQQVEVDTESDIAHVRDPPCDELPTFPPMPVHEDDCMDIIREFCRDIRPVCFEEKGCTVCGSLCLLTDLKPLADIEFSLDPLIEPSLVRRERLSSSDPIVYNTGPILDRNCDSICSRCISSLEQGKRPHFALANGLWVGNVPPILAKLTYTEQCLVARVRSNRYVVRVSSGHSKLTANAIAFSAPTVKVYQHLPPRKEEIQEVLAFIFTGVKPPTEEDLARTPMLVRRNVVADALEWLKLNHNDYSDLLIDYEALQSYPEAGVPVNVIYRPATDGSNVIAAATSVHDSGEEEGTTQGECSFTVHGLMGEALDDMSVEAKKAAALRHLRMGGFVLAVGHSESPEPMYDNYRLYPQMYPWLFPFSAGGLGNPRVRGLISETNHKKHLLHHHDKRFQKDARFLLMAFNHEQVKHGSASSFILAKRNNFPAIVSKVARINPAVVMNIAHRLEAGERVVPETDDEKMCFSVMDQIDHVGSRVHGSLASKKNMRNELWSLITRLGAPSWFITLSPVDHKHPLCIYWADEKIEFNPDLRQYNDRVRLVARNPVAAARFFHFLVQLFIKHMLRWSNEEGKGGIFGPTSGYYGTVEQQGRMTLHLHMLVWIKGAWNPQEVRNKLMSDDESFKKTLIEYLESCHIGEFQTGTMQDMENLHKNRSEDAREDPTVRLPVPPPPRNCQAPDCDCDSCVQVNEWRTQFKKTVDNIIYRSNIHKCYTRRDVVEDGVHKQHITGKGCINKEGICASRFPRDIVPHSYVDEDGRIFLKKLESMINNVNAVMSYAFACNTDTTSLGSGTAVKATAGYVADYIVKLGLKSYQIFSSIFDVFERNPDIWNQSASESDAARKLILKMANSLTSKIEIGGPMASLYLLGNPDHYSSHTFVPFYWKHFVNDVLRTWEDASSACTLPDGEATLIQTSYGIGHRDAVRADEQGYDPHIDVEEAPLPAENVMITRSRNQYITRSNVDDYKLRPLELENVCLYDWIQCAERKGITSKSKDLPPRHYLYSPGHPQRPTHMIHFDPDRVNLVVPNFLGAYLPRSDADDTELHSCSMLTFFVPWRTGLELRLSTQSWTEAYSDQSFSQKHEAIIKNMNIRYECYDARDDYHAQLKVRAQALRGEGADEVEDAAADEGEWDHEVSGLDLVDEGQFGSWTRTKLAQMRDIQAVLETAGWNMSNAPGISTVSEGVQPERSLPMSKWREVVANERKKKLSARTLPTHGIYQPQDSDLDIPSRIVNDARVVPGSYLFANFKTQDKDMEALMNSVIESFSLNEEQERAFRIVTNHSMCVGPEPLRMYLGGMGGTGKTRVIDALMDWFKQRGESHRMIVLAPTGAAASIINGSTYHSFLGVNTGKRKYLSEPRSNSLQEARLRMQGVEYIFLDEISMVSCSNFYRIDRRLKAIRQVHDVPFGGVNMIVAGDFAQLPPAGNAKKLYSGTVSKGQVARQTEDDQEDSLGLLLWHQFVTVVMLTQNMRQTEQSDDDNKLRDALTRMRYKSCTDEDLEFLRSRIPGHNPSINLNDPQWRNVSIITAWNSHKDQINEMSAHRFADEHGTSLQFFFSLDKQSANFNKQKKTKRSPRIAAASDASVQRPVKLTPEAQEALWKAQPHSSEHIAASLALCIDMPVMIRYNQATELSITKGQEAIVKGWVSRQIPGWPGRMCLETLFVQLLNPRSPVQVPYLPLNVVPLTRESSSISVILPNDATINITRQQIPILLNFAMTDYTSQGKTRTVNIVDIEHCKNNQAMYTCLSRGKSASNTMILRDFKVSKITGGLDGWLRQEFRDLDKLSDITRLQYEGMLPPGIVQRLRSSTLSAFKQVYGEDPDDQDPANPVANSRDIQPQTMVPSTGAVTHPLPVSHPKRSSDAPSQRPTKRVRIAEPNHVSNEPASSWIWDNTNWSCAFDSYLTVIFNILQRDTERWSAVFRSQGELMLQVADALMAMSRRERSRDETRQIIRQRFWDLNDESFPKGLFGSDLFALAQMLQGVRIENIVLEPTRRCSVCGQRYPGQLFESIGRYTMLRHTDPPTASVESSLHGLESKTTGHCAICHGRVYVNNTYPPLICVQLPEPLQQNGRTDAKVLIDRAVRLGRQRYRYTLAGVVYWSGLDGHFATRVFTVDGSIFSYDGMQNSGRLIHEGRLANLGSPSTLSNLEHRDAVLALYIGDN